MPPSRVHLSLGSNLGARETALAGALDALAGLPGTRVVRVSPVYETAPVGEVDQPPFLNLCAEIETDCAPLELLEAIKVLEGRLGRVPSRRWGPRSIDIDIVLWGDRLVREAALMVPHPEFRNRAFVLRPLADIAPEAVDPETGRCVAELAAEPGAYGEVVLTGMVLP